MEPSGLGSEVRSHHLPLELYSYNSMSENNSEHIQTIIIKTVVLLLCVYASRRPTFIDKIKDDKLREWALDLNSIWRRLGRRVCELWRACVDQTLLSRVGCAVSI